MELHGTRSIIYEYIRNHPGTHIREIRRALELGMGDLQYNLYVLEKQGMITTAKRGLLKFVFPTGVFGQKQSALLSALSSETQGQILIFLAKNANLTSNQIAHLTGLTSSTIAWHMKRLVELRLIERSRYGRSVHFNLLADPTEIAKFVRNYHPGFWENLSSRLSDIVLELSAVNSLKKD